jgi:hypothetical protein
MKDLKFAIVVAAIALVAVGAYFWMTKDSRAIAYHKARLQPSSNTPNSKVDQDALIKLGWLVRQDVHLSQQTVRTNAAKEFYQVARELGVQLKQPIFFSIHRPDPRKPSDIVFTAAREDLLAVERVIADWDSQLQR